MKYTKIDYKEIGYSQLPDNIKNKIAFEEFFSVYLGKDNYILHIMNKTKDTTIEVEYDIKKDKFLTRDERKLKVPSSRELIFLEYGIKILIQYYLEEKTDILIETYQIFSLETLETVEESKQNYFSMKRSFEDKAKEAYDNQESKKAYLTYNDEQKASYWSRIFYRWMRWEGENGSDDEVEFFQPEVIAKFKKEEPNLDRLMPIILKQLARMWMLDEKEFFDKVNQQLGTSYTNKKSMIDVELDFKDIKSAEELVLYVRKQLNLPYDNRQGRWDAFRDDFSDLIIQKLPPKDYIYQDNDEWGWKDYFDYQESIRMYGDLGPKNNKGEKDDMKLIFKNLNILLNRLPSDTRVFLEIILEWVAKSNMPIEDGKFRDCYRMVICIKS